MASQKITSDSGICLSAEKQNSKIPVRVSRSSSDSEHSSDEEDGHDSRYRRRNTRIPVAISRQNNGSDSSEEDHGRSKPTVTDSGINLKQGQSKMCKTSQLVGKENQPSKPKTKILSPRETRASALRIQAQFKKTASLESKRNKKDKTTSTDTFSDDEDREKSGSELDEALDRSVSSDEEEAQSVPLEMRDAVVDQDNEDSLLEKAPSLDVNFIPFSADNSAGEEKPQKGSDQGNICAQSPDGEFDNGADKNQESGENIREDTGGSGQLEEEPASVKNEEEAEVNYSDDSFEEEEEEEESSEVEITPTFEFNMTPPSIGNSGCEDSNEGVFKVRNTEDDDTASDVSELENQPVSCKEHRGITRGSLQKQHSSWKLFDDIPSDTDLETLKDEVREGVEAVEDKHHDHVDVIEMNNERKHVVDEELDRMDEEIFGLLRPAGQPSRVSVVYPGANDNGSFQNDSFSRKRKVRIIIDPEVFLVPYSSREFDEPFFEDIDDIPVDKKIESPFKNVNLGSFCNECGDDPDVNVEEDIPEEISPEVADLEDDDHHLCPGSDGFFKQGNGSACVEETQSPSDANITDENELEIDQGKMADDLHQNKDNLFVKADENAKDILLSGGVQKQSRLKNLNFDPNSQEFVDDLEDLLDGAEENIQEEISSKVAINLSTKEDVVPGTNALCRQDEEPNNASKTVEETHVTSRNELATETEIMGEELNHTSKNCPVNNEGAVDLPAYEDVKESKMYVDDQDKLLDSVEEDIQEEIICEYKSLDEEADIERQTFFITSGVETDGAEALTDTALPIELDNVCRQDLEEPYHKMDSTNQTENVVHHDDGDELLFVAANSRVAVILTGDTEGEDSFPDKNVVPKSISYENVNTIMERRSKDGDETVAVSIQTSNKEFYIVEGDGAECHPVVLEQTTPEVSLGNDIIDNKIEQGMNETTQSATDLKDESHKTTIPERLEASAIHTESLDTLDNLHAEIKALSTCNEELKRELGEKEQEKYIIECIIKSVSIENEKLLDQVDNLENELQTVRSENEEIDLELNRRHAKETDILQGTHTMEEHNTEIKALKWRNEELNLQLEESDKQKRNMDCIVEQVNIENEKLLERMDGLEKELEIALSRKTNMELQVNDLKEILQKTKKENEEETTGIAAELEQLKELHARIGNIRMEPDGKKEAAFENSLGEANVPKSGVNLLQELRVVMVSVLKMSDEFKATVLEILENSAQHKGTLETDLTQTKEEYLQTLEQQNVEIKTLKEHNEELQLQLKESDKQRYNMDCIVESVNMENEKLLERINGLENELKTALDEKNNIEKELNVRNSNEEYRERELSNLKDTMRCKTFNWEEMETTLDHVWNEKQKLEEELALITTTFEQSETAKMELIEEVNMMKLQLEKLQNNQTNCNKTVDYAYLREEVELIKGSLTLSDLPHKAMEKELESRKVRTSSISSDAEFADQKEQYKIRIEEQMGELEKENSLILQELAQASEVVRPFEHEEKCESASRNMEKEFKKMHEEFCQFRNESIHFLRKGEGAVMRYNKLKKRLIHNEKGIKSFVQSYQQDIQENKETDKDFKRQIHNDLEQIRFLLKDATENKANQDNEKKQSMEELLVNQGTEVNVLLEKTLLNLQRNDFEREMNRCNLRLENEKAQELENRWRELNKRLQEKEWDLELYRRKLKESDERVEGLNQQLQNEKEDNKCFRKSREAAEDRAKEQVKDKEQVVNQLRKLVNDSDENAENLTGKVRKITKELEDAKEALAKRETELSGAKASLCEGDELLNMFRKSLVEIQQELEETKRELIEKNVALEYTERYAEMLFKSAKTKDHEIGVTNKLVNKVVQDVVRVEKLLQRKTQPTVFDKSSQETITENELSGDQSYDVDSLQNQVETPLEAEKDRRITQLESSLSKLKQDLEVTSCSLKEKENELQQIICGFDKQKKELEISNGRSIKLEDENSSLQNELMQLNTLLSQQNDEVKDLRGLVITRDSELMALNMETEKFKFYIQAKEQNIHLMKREIAEKERENQSMLQHLQKKMAEIRRLQEALENMKIERCKSLEAYPGIIAHMKASGKSTKDLESLRKAFEHKVCDDKEGKISYLESVVARLQHDLAEKNVLLEEKDEDFATANVSIQVKEEELDIAKGRLRQLADKFEVYKQNASERESKLREEIRLRQEQNEIEELKSLLETKVIECGANDNPVNVNKREEEISQSFLKEENNAYEVEMAKLAGKQIANAMTDRIQLMLSDMNTMQMELKSSRNENLIVTKKNKAIKERVEKLQQQMIKNDQMHSERLNNVLDNVRMKRTEIQSLKNLLRKSQGAAGVPEESKSQEVTHCSTERLNNEVYAPDIN